MSSPDVALVFVVAAWLLLVGALLVRDDRRRRAELNRRREALRDAAQAYQGTGR